MAYLKSELTGSHKNARPPIHRDPGFGKKMPHVEQALQALKRRMPPTMDKGFSKGNAAQLFAQQLRGSGGPFKMGGDIMPMPDPYGIGRPKAGYIDDYGPAMGNGPGPDGGPAPENPVQHMQPFPRPQLPEHPVDFEQFFGDQGGQHQLQPFPRPKQPTQLNPQIMALIQAMRGGQRQMPRWEGQMRPGGVQGPMNGGRFGIQ